MDSTSKMRFLSDLEQLNWDFEGLSGQGGLAGLHWYPARFLPQIPGVLISYLSSPNDLVLDPFCGSGTTLVEAQRQGRFALGIDSNPVAVLMTDAKLTHFSAETFSSYSRDLERRILARLTDLQGPNPQPLQIPSRPEQERWYHPDTLLELGAIWEQIHLVESSYTSVGVSAFSNILRKTCSQDKHYGWICDNVHPKVLRYKPAVEPFLDGLRSFAKAASRDRGPDAVTAQVECGDSGALLASVADETVDLVVTSPPYFSMTDYARSQRLTFLWLELNLDEAKSAESGARFKRHRREAKQQYLAEIGRVVSQLHRVMRPNCYAAFVIGESPSRQPVVEEFVELTRERGFILEINATRQLTRQRAFNALSSESVLIFRKS